MKPPLILFGLGPFVELLAHHFEAEDGRRVIAQTAHRRFMPASWQGPRPLVAFEDLAAQFEPSRHDIFIALEHAEQNSARARIAREAESLGYGLASFVSPTARIAAGVGIGKHCCILDKVLVQAGAHIGENNILHANCFFGQANVTGDHNWFGAGFVADRHTRIGSFNVFGSHVRIGEGLGVGDWNFIKAFQVIEAPLTRPTLIDSGLRRPGYVVDRRHGG